MAFRITLTAACIVATVIYAFFVFVAVATSGNELLGMPWFYYAALMPFLYFIFCAASCWLSVDPVKLRNAGFVVHALALPLMRYSLLMAGLVFVPVFALLWWLMIRERTLARM